MGPFFALLLLLSPPRGAVADGEPPGPPARQAPSFLDVPLYDAPFNFERGYVFPSMRQSLALSTSFYEGMHRWIGGPSDQSDSWRFWGVIGFDLFSYWLPFGNNWMRSEWHRAVLTKNDISSYNDIYRFRIFSETISVTSIRDEELSRLKAENNPDMVRKSTAGFESRTAQNLLVERHHFFDDADTFDQFLLWMNALNSTVYLSICGSEGGNEVIQRMRVSEGSNIGKRDLTGLDCTAWTYDLFRPDEGYAARGTHPSGAGVNRYVNHSSLHKDEQEFLRLQMFLSLLNFADPFLYGNDDFTGKFFGREFQWNANLAHSPSSFGYVIDSRFFLRSGREKYLFTLHHGFGHHYYPGLSVELIDVPVGDGFFLTPSLTAWPQPAAQRLGASHREWLLAFSNLFSFQWTPLTSTYFGVQAKTPGWLLGDPYLRGNLAVWMGFKTAMF